MILFHQSQRQQNLEGYQVLYTFSIIKPVASYFFQALPLVSVNSDLTLKLILI